MTVPASLIAALAREGIAPANSAWLAQTGGRTNRVWKVDSPGGALICKLFNSGVSNPLYPNLPGAEYDALKQLYSHDISPEPVALLNTEAGDVLVYRHLPGEPWKTGVQEVAQLLRRLHSLDLEVPLRNLPSGSAALIRQISGILGRCKNIPPELEQGVTDPEIPELSTVSLIHTDVVPSNIISCPDGLRLIDWQCPAFGDPCEDLASFLSPAMQALYGCDPLCPPDVEGFLTAYKQVDIVTRYKCLAPLFHLRIAAYCLWKSEQGDSEYRAAMWHEISALSHAQQNE